MKTVTAAILVMAVAGVCFASQPMPVCGCITLEDCGGPILPQEVNDGLQFGGVLDGEGVLIMDFSLLFPEYPWSMPGTGWQCREFPGGAPASINATIWGFNHSVNISFYGLECCGSQHPGPVTPLFADGGIVLEWDETSTVYVWYGSREKIVAKFSEYGSGLLKVEVWELHKKFVSLPDLEMVVHYVVYQNPERLPPWEQGYELEVE